MHVILNKSQNSSNKRDQGHLSNLCLQHFWTGTHMVFIKTPVNNYDSNTGLLLKFPQFIFLPRSLFSFTASCKSLENHTTSFSTHSDHLQMPYKGGTHWVPVSTSYTSNTKLKTEKLSIWSLDHTLGTTGFRVHYKII